VVHEQNHKDGNRSLASNVGL